MNMVNERADVRNRWGGRHIVSWASSHSVHSSLKRQGGRLSQWLSTCLEGRPGAGGPYAAAAKTFSSAIASAAATACFLLPPALPDALRGAAAGRSK